MITFIVLPSNLHIACSKLIASGLWSRALPNPALRADKTTALVRGYIRSPHSGLLISRKRKILRVKQFHDTQRVTLNSSTIHRSTGQRPVFRPPSTGLNLMIQGLNYIHSPSDKTNVSILFLAWGSDYPLFPIPHGVPKQHGTCHMVILQVRGYIRSPFQC